MDETNAGQRTDPSSEFLVLRTWLRDWPSPLPRMTFAFGPHRRLLDAVEGSDGLADLALVGPLDVATLVRHALLAQEARHNAPFTLVVPSGPRWPTHHHWGVVGCHAVDAGPGRLEVSAGPWMPDWLAHSGGLPIGKEAFAAGDMRHRRRPDLTMPGDPYLEAASLGQYQRYTSAGQRQALRAVLLAPPGSTTLINLPTGEGKSAVATIPATLEARHGGLTLFVVPTVSLALDQEARLQALDEPTYQRALAYVGGKSDADRERIRRGILDGSQTLVLLNPESAIAGLSHALTVAAQTGRLRLFVIDEAHLVEQWGSDFRPAFQQLSGLRRHLLREAAANGYALFKTVLLSGTLGRSSVELLGQLFDEPGPFEIISSSTLRREPDYWASACVDSTQRAVRLAEAVAHLPRPMIIYTARKSDAAYWVERLRDEGYARVGLLTGDTQGEVRQDVLQRFQGSYTRRGVKRTEYDIVVGTSAFGLGIDQSDVRTVIHACIPETVDRFYQEVGRGGRDGNPSVSLTLYEPGDRAVASSLASTTLISEEVGYPRWEALWASAGGSAPDGRARVRLDALRTETRSGRPGLFASSDRNVEWNERTMALMVRAGLIEFDADTPPNRRAGESESEWETKREDAWSEYLGTAVIRLRHGSITADEWGKAVAQVATETRRRDRINLTGMLEALTGQSKVCDLLLDTYTLPPMPARHGEGHFPVKACGVCDYCGHPGSWTSGTPTPPTIPFVGPVAEWLSERAGNEGRLFTFYDRPRSPAQLQDWVDLLETLIPTLMRHGVRTLIASGRLLGMGQFQRAHVHVPERFVFLHDYRNCVRDDLPPVATAAFLGPLDDVNELPSWLWNARLRRPTVFILPKDVEDPDAPSQLAVVRRFPQISLSTLVRGH
ncbi:protein DpdF [Terrabacter sp. Root181]|uniref:protein DpdF n=1 Tax=Terrabacter sp. Root181 TaxID=1736484 RepID=UPI00138F6008|nr:protein DpdF [Terrabacter sp. Root181]